MSIKFYLKVKERQFCYENIKVASILSKCISYDKDLFYVVDKIIKLGVRRFE